MPPEAMWNWYVYLRLLDPLRVVLKQWVNEYALLCSIGDEALVNNLEAGYTWSRAGHQVHGAVESVLQLNATQANPAREAYACTVDTVAGHDSAAWMHRAKSGCKNFHSCHTLPRSYDQLRVVLPNRDIK